MTDSNTPYDRLKSEWNTTNFTENIHLDRDAVDIEHDKIFDWFIDKMKAHDLTRSEAARIRFEAELEFNKKLEALREAIEGMKGRVRSNEEYSTGFDTAIDCVSALLSSNKQNND